MSFKPSNWKFRFEKLPQKETWDQSRGLKPEPMEWILSSAATRGSSSSAGGCYHSSSATLQPLSNLTSPPAAALLSQPSGGEVELQPEAETLSSKALISKGSGQKETLDRFSLKIFNVCGVFVVGAWRCSEEIREKWVCTDVSVKQRSLEEMENWSIHLI